ncbi:MAG: GDP-mannose 4,6-dehydratase [Candidatus Sericytochromatia bacterium]
MKKAFITGITGQDGSYLAELLLAKDYEVHGLIRWSSTFSTLRIKRIFSDPHQQRTNLHLHYGDLNDSSRLTDLLRQIQPDEVYNLGAQSHVRVSFDSPYYTSDVVGMGTQRMLEAVLTSCPQARFYQASSSEMFGHVQEIPQSESTPFYPCSPYACAKVFAHWLTINTRESRGLYACSGILFNHESPRRGETFVTRKISMGIAAILAGKLDRLYLGNLNAKRDWGYAKEYVEGMWRMLQQPEPDDYVLATGETHTVREFLERCCSLVGLDPEQVVSIDPRYFRPREVDLLIGDPAKAKAKLGWEAKTTFDTLVPLMLAADIEAAGLDPRAYGLEICPDKAFRSFSIDSEDKAESDHVR